MKMQLRFSHCLLGLILLSISLDHIKGSMFDDLQALKASLGPRKLQALQNYLTLLGTAIVDSLTSTTPASPASMANKDDSSSFEDFLYGDWDEDFGTVPEKPSSHARANAIKDPIMEKKLWSKSLELPFKDKRSSVDEEEGNALVQSPALLLGGTSIIPTSQGQQQAHIDSKSSEEEVATTKPPKTSTTTTSTPKLESSTTKPITTTTPTHVETTTSMTTPPKSVKTTTPADAETTTPTIRSTTTTPKAVPTTITPADSETITSATTSTSTTPKPVTTTTSADSEKTMLTTTSTSITPKPVTATPADVQTTASTATSTTIATTKPTATTTITKPIYGYSSTSDIHQLPALHYPPSKPDGPPIQRDIVVVVPNAPQIPPHKAPSVPHTQPGNVVIVPAEPKYPNGNPQRELVVTVPQDKANKKLVILMPNGASTQGQQSICFRRFCVRLKGDKGSTY